jgi:hypothetical protein
MTRILLAPGIGDIHWVMLKLESFIEKNHLDKPEIWLWNFDKRPRGMDFVERVPFVKAGGYWDHPLEGEAKRIFNLLYKGDEFDIVKGFHYFDYFICPNGKLRTVVRLEDSFLEGYATNWKYEIKMTAEEEAYAFDALELGSYILLYFSDQGMFRHWIRQWPLKSIVEFITLLSESIADARLILTGSDWDLKFNNVLSSLCGLKVTNLTGKTNLSQLLGLIRGASAFVGWPGGNTIISTHLGVTTHILWSDYFEENFFSNWADPSKIERSYIFDTISKIKPDDAIAHLLYTMKANGKIINV